MVAIAPAIPPASGFVTVPLSRWDATALPLSGPVSARAQYGVFMENVGDLDMALFQIQPIEANSLDPQQKLLLDEHGHVTPHPVHHARNLAQDAEHGLTKLGLPVVELHCIFPRLPEQPPAKGKRVPPRLEIAARVAHVLVVAALDEKVRVCLDPRVVDGNVVWDKIDDDPHPS